MTTAPVLTPIAFGADVEEAWAATLATVGITDPTVVATPPVFQAVIGKPLPDTFVVVYAYESPYGEVEWVAVYTPLPALVFDADDRLVPGVVIRSA